MRIFLTTLLLPLIAVVVLNLSVNVGGLGEHEEVMAISAKQTAGQLLSSETVFDQRAWLKARLKAACPAVLVVGSSTVGGIRQEMLPGKTLLNGWLGGGLTPEDYEALISVLKDNNCVPESIVVGVDLWSVGNAAFTDQRWTNWFDDYVRFHEGDLIHRAYAARIGWSRFTEVLNFTTTRASAFRLVHRLKGKADESQLPQLYDMAGAEYCKTIGRPHTIRSFDGHYTDCDAWAHSPSELERIADNYLVDDPHGLKNWTRVDDDRMNHLERIVELLARRGSRVVLVAMPYHPTTYRHLLIDPTVASNLKTVSARLAALERLQGVKFFDLRDPTTTGCLSSEFQDSHHSAPACTAKVATALVEKGAL